MLRYSYFEFLLTKNTKVTRDYASPRAALAKDSIDIGADTCYLKIFNADSDSNNAKEKGLP